MYAIKSPFHSRNYPAANDNSDQPCACNNPNFAELTLLCWLSDLGLGLGFMLNQIYLASLPGTIPYFSTRHHSALIFCCQNSTLQIEHQQVSLNQATCLQIKLRIFTMNNMFALVCGTKDTILLVKQ